MVIKGKLEQLVSGGEGAADPYVLARKRGIMDTDFPWSSA